MLLITGATGFIGQHLARALPDARCLVRRETGLTNAVRGDLLDAASLERALDGVETVIHLAGVTKALRAADYQAGNATATENLLRHCGKVKRFVHVSSLAAAGPSADGKPITEDAVPRPVSEYGRSKLAGERAVLESSIADRAVIVRPPVVFGPGDGDVLQIFQSVAKGVFMRIGRAESYFSAIYVHDLVEGLIAAAKSPNAGGRTYFLSHEKPLGWCEFAQAIASTLGRPVRMMWTPAAFAYTVGCIGEVAARVTGKPGIISRDKIREGRQRYWICDTGRAARELNFRAPTPATEAVAATARWYKEQGWLK